MIASPNRIAGPARLKLAEQAVRTASQIRLRANLDQFSPVCVYDVCLNLGLSVRFNDLDMEGMYQRSNPPVIHLSAKRPLARRAFNCAHELAHHIFGHGSSIDELNGRSSINSWENPEELLADTFAAHFLMPTIGIRGAFNRRSIDISRATPIQIYTVACEFGVGYGTLVTQLLLGINAISNAHAKKLKRHSPKSIRETLLDHRESKHLIVAVPSGNASAVDVEVGSHVLVPQNSIADTEKLVPLGAIRNGSLFIASRPGKTSIKSSNWQTQIRISRARYVGLAQYRHLEEAA